jgi:hypothetical protein
LAGVLVAYGAFSIIAAITAAALTAMGFDSHQLSNNDWRQLGIGGGIAVCLSLFLSYLWGGYVAGRMARRAGGLNGVLVSGLSLLVAAGVGAAVGMQTNPDAVRSNLRSIGVPTSMQEWTAIATFAGIGAIVAMLLGSLLGGMLGERWHGVLMARAMDPTIGPEVVDIRDDKATTRRGDDIYAARQGAHFDGWKSNDTSDDPRDVWSNDTTLDEDLERTRTAH